MRKQNDGKSEDDILQNRFTAYLLVAVKRYKVNYIKHKEKMKLTELLLDISVFHEYTYTDMENDLTMNLLPLDQILNPLLYLLLVEANDRERYILLAKILEQRSFIELSKELGISYKATTYSYHHLIKTIKKILGTTDKMDGPTGDDK